MKLNIECFKENLVKTLYSEIPLRDRLKDYIKKGLWKTRKHIGKIGVGIYEGILAKYLHDLYGVFRDPMVRMMVERGKLPFYCELFPWPIYNPLRLPIEPPYPMPTIIPTKPMGIMDYAVKFFYDNPILQGLAIVMPLIGYGIYYGYKRSFKPR